MQHQAYLQILGIVSIILTWLAIAFILLNVERNLEKSVSHHVATKKSNHIIFSIVMSASLLCLSIFVYFWLIPSYSLSGIFSAVIGLAILLEYVTTWIPLTTGWRYVVHQLCSYGAACLLPILMFLVVRSPKISSIPRYISLGALCVMIALLCLFIFVKATRRHYLIYQNIYVIAFHISLLSMIRII